VRKLAFPVDVSYLRGVLAPRPGDNWHGACLGSFLRVYRGGGQTMQRGAIWIIYTLMFGYPVPTHDEHEFTNRAACEIYKHSYSEQVVDAFKLVCSTK
jgi:hypothetical protein